MATRRGTARRDILKGTARNDTLFGLGGNDVLYGLGGKDTLNGGAGNDKLIAGASNDLLNGGTGADTLNGGAGIDTATYASAKAGVTALLSVGIGTTGEATGDRFISIENITGSNFSDILGGNAGLNVINGGAGDDTIIGSAGADTLMGGVNGAGGDTLSYENSTVSVNVILSVGSGVVKNGDAEGDVISGFENITGSNASGLGDNLTGNAGNNVIFGLAGHDTLDGGLGTNTIHGGDGDDTITGTGGTDTAFGDTGKDSFFFGADGGTATLDGGADNDDFWFIDTISGISGVSGNFTIQNFNSVTDIGAPGDAGDTIHFQAQTASHFWSASSIGDDAQFTMRAFANAGVILATVTVIDGALAHGGSGLLVGDDFVFF